MLRKHLDTDRYLPDNDSMPADTAERVEAKHELDFTTYETLCNQNNRSSRKCGILSQECYDAVFDDESTIKATVDEVTLPVLIDMKHGLGMGYDEDRSRSYADATKPVSILAVPIGDMDKPMQEKIIDVIASNPDRSIYFADNEGRDNDALIEGLRTRGLLAVETPILNPRCRPENRQASLSLYTCDNTLENYNERSPRIPLSKAQEHFDDHVMHTIEDPYNACILRNGAKLSQAELDDIWDLYTNRFQFLGEHHPISMEDTKADFMGTLTSEDVTASIKYVDGKPVCFTFFTDNVENLYWLNPDYLKAMSDERPNLTPIFFPGIVARGADGKNAQEVIRLFAAETAAVGINDRIIFENTNLSEMYVPRIVFDSVNESSDYRVEKPHKVDTTQYRLITV